MISSSESDTASASDDEVFTDYYLVMIIVGKVWKIDA